MPDTTRRSQYDALRSKLWTIRASGFDAEYQDLADFIAPRRVRFWSGERNRGQRKSAKILDSACRFASRTQSAGMHSGMTSPARPWMQLSTPDPDLAQYAPVKEWLHEVTERMLTAFAQSNLYQALPTGYTDLGIFGTGAMSVLDDTKDLFRAYSYPVGSYAVGLDERGLATTFCRQYELSVRQVVEQFGAKPGRQARGRDIDWRNISTMVRSLWDQHKYEESVPIWWIVTPNEEYNPDHPLARYSMKWASCHYEADQDAPGAPNGFLRESGFNEFPIMVPTWDRTGEDSYGTDCPGMIALSDVKQLMGMQRKKGQAINKMVDPPLVGPTSLRTQKTSLLSGDITYEDSRDGMKGLRSIHEVNLRLDYLLENIVDVRQSIERAFYSDLFRTMARMDEQRGAQPVTAREIDERHEEKLIELGPVLEHMNDELLEPMVDRVYAMMERNGLIPEAPPELEGVKLTVVYTSILSQAMKLVGVTGQDRFLNGVLQMAQVVGPDVLDVVDFDRAVRNSADMLGVDPKLLRDPEEVKARTDARAKQQASAAAAAQAKDVAGAVAQAGAAPVAPDSALDRMLSNLQAPGGQAATAA